jgi:hypothetical protein
MKPSNQTARLEVGMASQDRSCVSAETYHDFHREWTIEIRNWSDSGVLPDGYYAMADQRFIGAEPDIVALRLRGPEPTRGVVVAETPPRIKQSARLESEPALYASKANRIAIRHEIHLRALGFAVASFEAARAKTINQA